MFEHKDFDIYSFESVPTDRDCYLMDESYLEAYEKYMLRVPNFKRYLKTLILMSNAKGQPSKGCRREN